MNTPPSDQPAEREQDLIKNLKADNYRLLLCLSQVDLYFYNLYLTFTKEDPDFWKNRKDVYRLFLETPQKMIQDALKNL